MLNTPNESYEDGLVRENRERFAAHLEAFKAAASNLSESWDAIEDPFAVDGYPSWMPSFDEAVLDIGDMSVRRCALTHDQLQALARLADDYSKGAYGEDVASVTLELR